MEDFSIKEMLDMQKTLHEKYKDQWGELSSKVGRNQLLWMVCEVGEVIDIVKKHSINGADIDAMHREHFVEEMADVLMYYNDVMLCYGITPAELKKAYTKKFQTNMDRW